LLLLLRVQRLQVQLLLAEPQRQRFELTYSVESRSIRA
jgi:hypothetical protein